uniref:hypothetical protein n=1 Tax=Alistipes ihumii TaxID=1470347 RepID=UPI003FEE33D2
RISMRSSSFHLVFGLLLAEAGFGLKDTQNLRFRQETPSRSGGQTFPPGGKMGAELPCIGCGRLKFFLFLHAGVDLC